MKDGGEEVEGALNPAKEWVPERVEAKTDVVRCKFLLGTYLIPITFQWYLHDLRFY